MLNHSEPRVDVRPFSGGTLAIGAAIPWGCVLAGEHPQPPGLQPFRGHARSTRFAKA